MKKVLLISLGVILSFVIIFLVFVYQKVATIEDQFVQLVDEEVNQDIVIVDVGDANRSQIASLIRKVKDFEAKTIAVALLFPDLKEEGQDNLLKTAILSGDVFLQAKHQGIGFYGTNKYFVSKQPVGYFEPVLVDNKVESFYLHRTMKERPVHNLAYQIALDYDPDKTTQYPSLGQPQSLIISRQPEQFKHFDKDLTDATKEDIKGKIILIGYLGKEDQFHTHAKLFREEYNSAPDMYGVEILANQVMMILEGLH